MPRHSTQTRKFGALPPLRPDAMRSSVPLFSILSTLVEDRVGIHYEAQDVEVFTSKVSARAAESGFDSLLDYYYYLRYDDEGQGEFDALVESLVVGETYFFRELEQLKALTDWLAELIARGGRPRVWSAACATGEEPLTLAMLLAERGLLASIEIVASDISTRSLARAREGVYTGRSLRALEEPMRARWFVEDGDRVRVRPEIVAAVEWHRVNLLDAGAVRALGRFDAILCRNVLIYFSEPTVGALTARLGDMLCDGGLLLIGASESLLRYGTMLKCEERRGAFFYRKTA